MQCELYKYIIPHSYVLAILFKPVGSLAPEDITGTLIWAHKTSLTSPLYTEVPVPNQDN